MSLQISGDVITSDLTESIARQGLEGWEVTGYPDRRFDRNQAITAMVLAELRSKSESDQELIAVLETELAR